MPAACTTTRWCAHASCSTSPTRSHLTRRSPASAISTRSSTPTGSRRARRRGGAGQPANLLPAGALKEWGKDSQVRSNLHMTKWVIALLAAAALVVPAAAYADDGGQGNTKSPAQQCRAERTANPTGFKEKYGTNHNKSNAFGKCVSQKAKEHENGDDNNGDERDNAAELCRAERSKDAAAFKEKYGTNHNKANAFGKCVSKTAHSLNKSDQDDNAGQSGDQGQSGDDHGKSGENHGPPS